MYDFKVYEPMLVGKAPEDYLDLLDGDENWLGSVKKDGYWEQLVKEDGEVHLFSRNVSKDTGFYCDKIDNVLHIKKWAEEALPDGTVIIGEIYYPGKTSKDVTKVMGCLADKAVERQREFGDIHFYCHDMIKYEGKDFVDMETPYSIRYSELCRRVDLNIPKEGFIEVAGIWDNVYCNMDKVLSDIFSQGEEGMVFRTEEGLYLPGKRKPKVMFKVKEQRDNLDLVIMEILDPEKEYSGKDPDNWPYAEDGIPVTKAYHMGWKNALRLGAVDDNGNVQEVCRVSSGIPDWMKEDLADNPQDYLGLACEISAMSVDSDRKTIRHPRFIRMRYDKRPEECKMYDVFSK